MLGLGRRRNEWVFVLDKDRRLVGKIVVTAGGGWNKDLRAPTITRLALDFDKSLIVVRWEHTPLYGKTFEEIQHTPIGTYIGTVEKKVLS